MDKERLLKVLKNTIVPSTLLMAALWVGLYRVDESGPLHSDASRYANGAAMIHDWLRSDSFLRPYAFAQENYSTSLDSASHIILLCTQHY